MAKFPKNFGREPGGFVARKKEYRQSWDIPELRAAMQSMETAQSKFQAFSGYVERKISSDEGREFAPASYVQLFEPVFDQALLSPDMNVRLLGMAEWSRLIVLLNKPFMELSIEDQWKHFSVMPTSMTAADANIHKLTQDIPRQSCGPADCASLLDRFVTAAEAANVPIDVIESIVVSLHPYMANDMIERYDDHNADVFVKENYRIDALGAAKEQSTRNALLNNTQSFDHTFPKYKFLALVLGEAEERLPIIEMGEYFKAVMSTDHPRHVEAKSMLDKFLYNTQLGESGTFLANLAVTVDEMKAIHSRDDHARQEFSEKIKTAPVEKRLEQMAKYIAKIRGEQGAAKFFEIVTEYKKNTQYINRLLRYLREANAIPRRDHLALLAPARCELDQHGRPIQRVVEELTLDTYLNPPSSRETEPLPKHPELEAEQLKNLRNYVEAMLIDLETNTVAIPDLPNNVEIAPGYTLYTELKPGNRFPAIDVTIVSAEFTFTTHFDEQFNPELVPRELSDEQNQVLEITRAYIIAALHDHVINKTTRIQTEQTVIQPKPALETTTDTEPGEPVKKPKRVHTSNDYVVITDKPQDVVQVEPIPTTNRVIVVERRLGHWREEAPGLVKAARWFAWKELEENGKLAQLSEQEKTILQRMLLDQGRTEQDEQYGGINQYTEEIINQLENVKPGQASLLEKGKFPLDEFTEAEENYYYDLFSEWTRQAEINQKIQAGVDPETYQQLTKSKEFSRKIPKELLVDAPEYTKPSTWGMPRIISKGEDTSFTQRIQADLAAGKILDLPERRRPTQNYEKTADSTYEAEVKSGYTRLKNETLIKATSAVDAVRTILSSQSSPKV